MLKPPSHTQRMLNEYAELTDKIQKLFNFINSLENMSTFDSLTSEQQGLLRIQHDAMKTYAEVLRQRIVLEQSIEASKGE